MSRAKVILGLIGVFSAVVFAPREAAAQPGTVTGVLRDAGTNAQIGGGVSAFTVNGVPAQIVGVFGASPTTPYQIVGLQPGTYFLKASSTGYVPALHGDIACVAIDCPVSIGTPVVVGAGATVTVDFALSHGGAFRGTVRSAASNHTLPDVTVQVYNASTSLVKGVVTDFSGNYTVDELPPGTYFARTTTTSGISVQDVLHELYGGLLCPPSPDVTDPTAYFRPDPVCRIASGTPIVVTNSVTTSGIDFSLDPSGTITGGLVDEGTSAPLIGAWVALFRGEVEIARTQTSTGGFYMFAGLAPGNYRVRTDLTQGNDINEWNNGACIGCAGSPVLISVPAGGLVTGIDFALSAGGTINGRITCQFRTPGEFLLTPVISAFNAAGTLVRAATTFPCSDTAPIDYQLDGLPAGQYYLLARDTPSIPLGIRPYGGVFVDKLYGDVVCNTVDCDVRRGAPVTVSVGTPTTGIDFQMAHGAQSEYVPDLSQPISVFDSHGVEMVSVVRSSAAFHSWQVVGLPNGTYFARQGNRLHGRGLCPDCPPTSGRPIIIGPGGVDYFPPLGIGTDFLLDFGDPSASQKISGVVRNDAGGAALSTIGVELYTDAAKLVASTSTNLLGQYTLGNVAPGTYFVRTRNDRGFVDEVYPSATCLDCDPRTGTPVVVATSDVTGIDFTIAMGGVVAGTVSDESGIVLGRVPVTLLNADGTTAGQAMSGSDGAFRLTLPVGTYRARAEPSPTHGAEVYSEQTCMLFCDDRTGTPITATAGTITRNINFTLASCSAMTLSPPLLASGVVGRPYRQFLSVSGGTGVAVFWLTDGVLPLGVDLLRPFVRGAEAFASATVGGTPTASGRHQVTIGALDFNGCATARTYTLDVQDCAFTLSPASATVSAAGGTVTVTVGDSCGPQTVTSTSFVSEQSNSPGQVVLQVPPNPGAAARTDAVTIGRRVFTVRQAGLAPQPPFGTLDTPADGAQVSGSIAVGGWALDDLEVRQVQLFRDPVGGEPPEQVFLGTAVFVAGARPDVAQAYPSYPLNNRAGWGFLILTNMLQNQGNGTFRIYAYADDAEGSRALLGAKTIVVNNATATLPFGAIDTPGQGETIAGRFYMNWGWALTPQPKIIPTDGWTIEVLVDGVPLFGVPHYFHPTYNLFRSDVSSLFPGLANSGGPVGYLTIDTAALAEGQHTIAWVVADSLGATAGIGSRYFSVANSADAQVLALKRVDPPAESSEPIAVEPVHAASSIAVVAGPDIGRRSASLAEAPAADDPAVAPHADEVARPVRANGKGGRTLTLGALERLELDLAPAEAARCVGTWAGYLVEKDTLGDLPVGAAIDPAGTFYWQPGPGFLGTFELLFVRTACDGSKERLPVAVTIGSR